MMVLMIKKTWNK